MIQVRSKVVANAIRLLTATPGVTTALLFRPEGHVYLLYAEVAIFNSAPLLFRMSSNIKTLVNCLRYVQSWLEINFSVLVNCFFNC